MFVEVLAAAVIGACAGAVGMATFSGIALSSARADVVKWKDSFNRAMKERGDAVLERDCLQERLRRLQPTLDLGLRRKAAQDRFNQAERAKRARS